MPFDEKVFTGRELILLKTLSDKHKATRAIDLISQTHEENMPWDKTLKSKGKDAVIDYFLILESAGATSEEDAKFISLNNEDSNRFFKTLNA